MAQSLLVNYLTFCKNDEAVSIFPRYHESQSKSQPVSHTARLIEPEKEGKELHAKIGFIRTPVGGPGLNYICKIGVKNENVN